MFDWIFSADARLMLAGCLGGAVNWLTRKATLWDGVTQIAVGGICAVYLSPIAIPALTPVFGNIIATPEELARLSGFAIGLGGVSVSGFFLDFWHRYRDRGRSDERGQ
ncbi:hypothetical protein [Aurantimonas phage AmM-1]|uniref:hypothetical protein n=1 Tax=Aurantimonas phage AmM-1 TaxID=1503929 RepID=UPI0005406F2B|nr:hypothetical protein ACQ23_gp31 [Aurantimonas phage AmM-1]BAP94488.1 hypothetical protein [Aurantimonas phage AmM-1]